jgi:hypothetical protein
MTRHDFRPERIDGRLSGRTSPSFSNKRTETMGTKERRRRVEARSVLAPLVSQT